MEVFQSNRREEKKLAKKIKRKHKRYWIGYLVAAALCVLMWIRSYDLIIGEGVAKEELFSVILLMFGYNILYVIGVAIAILFALGGGRDQLMAHLSDEIRIGQDSIQICYQPKVREIDNGDYVEYEIRPSGVKSLEYDERYRCLEMLADCSKKVWAYRAVNPEGITQSSHENKKFMIYDSYDRMDELKSELQRVTGKQIVNTKGRMRF